MSWTRPVTRLEVTEEMREAVARDECRRGGHVFDEPRIYGSVAPAAVVCPRCGETWRIDPRDAGRDFPSESRAEE